MDLIEIEKMIAEATVKLEAENARLREQLRCVRDNLSKGMSKSMQKLQAREIDAAIRGEA